MRVSDALSADPKQLCVTLKDYGSDTSAGLSESVQDNTVETDKRRGFLNGNGIVPLYTQPCHVFT